MADGLKERRTERTDEMAMKPGLNNDMAFKKDLTVGVELVGEVRINVAELMKCVRELCGGLVACRYTGLNKYEVTMSHIKGKERLLEGFKIGNTSVIANELNNDELVVSFLNLPAYLADEDILDKLHGWGVTATSAIRRRMWPGTNVADGTRFVRVKFNNQVQSLPYSAKFTTALGPEYFRVIHDRQVRVCRLCIQPGHILRDCPEFMCHKCGVQGHYARECGRREEKCTLCRMNMSECMCNNSEGEVEEASGAEGESSGEEEAQDVSESPVVSTRVTGGGSLPEVSEKAGETGPEKPIGGEGGAALEGGAAPEPQPMRMSRSRAQSGAKARRASTSPSVLPSSQDSDCEMDLGDVKNVRKRQSGEWQAKSKKKSKGKMKT